ncbi:DUF6962 family protein [Fluviicola taffensis]|uniref:DUF6962 family protein n=1 Tax=Fluviicola taffensis TaxID=191579 RepID=UPI0011D2B1A7|nr:hypothetical protein [Fluviicola taffensis]
MEKIQFEFLGLHLQEPMALLFNWIIAGFCFFAFSKLGKFKNEANFYWRAFYLFFGISTVFGGLGHLFFNYTGFFGKYPCWILGCVANSFSATGMLKIKGVSNPKKYAFPIIWIKSIGLCVAAILTQKFIFVAIDAILTYIIYTGVYAFILMKRSEQAKFLKNMIIGVIILTPSAFIFIFKLDVHKWLNKDDLSHILMFCTIYYFYRGLKEWGQKEAQLNHV